MNKLPAEVLIPIFSYLNKPDHLECVHVCKQWYEIISNSFLYQKVKFGTADNLHKAIDLFDRKRKFGELVEDLTIRNCRLDVYSILSMPRQIPNVKFLNWSEPGRPSSQRRRLDDATDIPSKLVYNRELGKWKNIEKITARVERLPFVSMLLESTPLIHLTELDLSFDSLAVCGVFDEDSLDRIHAYVKLLMKNIKSAPELREIKLIHPVLDLDEMELLHAGTPKLKKIEFEGVVLGSGAQSDMVVIGDTMRYREGRSIAQEPADSITQLLISFVVNADPSSIHNVAGPAKEVMFNWLSYIGIKYNNLEYWMLKGQGKTYLPRIQEFEQPTVKIISKLKKIKTYHAFLYPITKAVTDAFDRNENGTLKSLLLYTDSLEELESQINFVNTSKQARTITTLRINGQGMDMVDCPVFDTLLAGLAQNFIALRSLMIKVNMHYSAMVKFLRTLPELTVLHVFNLRINLGESMPFAPIVKCNLHHLSVDLDCEKKSTMYQLNQYLDFLLQSCPQLINFRIGGKLAFVRGIVRLCFFDHPNLESIFVKIQGVQYYTFPWTDGKQGIEWENYHKEAVVKDMTGTKLHVEISFRGDQVKLDLAKAPVTLI
ncbi:uncharacterized protein EV154DRAFT_517585 [Mucor mucedo]|uniref:uncharacterized protein n=1 Tax=Mucor mucedo TaxID=29922 RepID=UPI0022205511|nr:uncharacterized protein EV154DRAFT_517585 [Mucor mucedo]KAI7888482.1 hypothetical protein EV154DRAFT_517585 [Mucor mucedo]